MATASVAPMTGALVTGLLALRRSSMLMSQAHPPTVLVHYSGKGDVEAFALHPTLGDEDSLFHAVAMGLEFITGGVAPHRSAPGLPMVAMRLREQAVDLLGAPDLQLHLGGRGMIASRDLLRMVAERQPGASRAPLQYLQRIYELGGGGGGAELVALSNALRRPVVVFKPASAGELEAHLVLGRPVFQNASALHVLSVDGMDWTMHDGELQRCTDPEAGAPSFHALLPTEVPPRRDEDIRARIGANPEALAEIRRLAAQDPLFLRAMKEIAADPSKARSFAGDEELKAAMARLLALLNS